jgi:hypothetical protein
MLVFPFSFLAPVAVVGLGLLYVWAGRLSDWRSRLSVRGGLLLMAGAAPLCTRGPGPAQLVLGLLIGYLALRMVAVSRCRAIVESGGRAVLLALVTPTGLLRASSRPVRRPWVAVLAGCAGISACVVLLVLGNRWRLWNGSRLGHFLDDQLVVLEVGVGAAGVHGLIVGVAQLLGLSVVGLLDHPFRSTSLTDFWGRRWNHLVQSNLAKGFYWPLARAGHPALGTVAAFAASGVMHMVAILGAGSLPTVALPCVWILWCFLGHGAAVLIEQRLGWNVCPAGRLSHAMARIRTIVLFLALSPGLIEPFAAVANVHGRSLGQPDGPSCAVAQR